MRRHLTANTIRLPTTWPEDIGPGVRGLLTATRDAISPARLVVMSAGLLNSRLRTDSRNFLPAQLSNWRITALPGRPERAPVDCLCSD